MLFASPLLQPRQTLEPTVSLDLTSSGKIRVPGRVPCMMSGSDSGLQLKLRDVLLLLFGLLWIQAGFAQGLFSRKLHLQGVSFHVTCANEGSRNTLRIEPSGRLKESKVIEQEIDGTVAGAEVADLDRDGVPEIYVYVQSAGSGSYGSVVGYAVNKQRTITPIDMPELSNDPKASAGYMGRDRFAIVDGWMVRSFPLYRPQDLNSAPSGGTRQLRYRLVKSEATWLLRPDPSKTRDLP